MGLRVRWPRPWPAFSPQGGAVSPTRYRAGLYQFLAVFRFLAFAMGMGLYFAPREGGSLPLWPLGVAGGVALFAAVQVAFRLYPERLPPPARALLLGLDLLLALAAVLSTGALESPFLLYSLAPVLTAALLADLPSAVAVGATVGLAPLAVHLTSGLGWTPFPPLLEGNRLAVGLLFLLTALLVAHLPFLANLNWQVRLRRDLVAEERHRLRRELHDSVAQVLAFLSLKVRRAEERSREGAASLTRDQVEAIARAVEQSYLAVRDFLDALEDLLPPGSLQDALREAVARWSAQTGIPVDLRLEGEGLRCPEEDRHHLVQIVREALANVARHSGATAVEVSLSREGPEAVLRVRDNGRGIPPGTPPGHGTAIMRERARIIGAVLEVDSAPGRGTEVRVRYPLNRAGREG